MPKVASTMARSSLLVSIPATKVWSTLRVSKGYWRNAVSDEYPVPKSSMAKRTPSR